MHSTGGCDICLEVKVIGYSRVLETENSELICRCIRQGGVIIYPTDTLYGVGGDFLSVAVHEQIDRLKGRSDSPYLAAVADMGMLRGLVADIPEIFSSRLARLLPGRFSFLFSAAAGLDPRLLRQQPTIGIRMPDMPSLLELIHRSAAPWVSTSVNRRGQPPLTDPEEISRLFDGADLFIEAGVLPQSAASTIVDVSVRPPRIRRRGVGVETVERLLGNPGP